MIRPSKVVLHVREHSLGSVRSCLIADYAFADNNCGAAANNNNNNSEDFLQLH